MVGIVCDIVFVSTLCKILAMSCNRPTICSDIEYQTVFVVNLFII